MYFFCPRTLFSITPHIRFYQPAFQPICVLFTGRSDGVLFWQRAETMDGVWLQKKSHITKQHTTQHICVCIAFVQRGSAVGIRFYFALLFFTHSHEISFLLYLRVKEYLLDNHAFGWLPIFLGQKALLEPCTYVLLLTMFVKGVPAFSSCVFMSLLVLLFSYACHQPVTAFILYIYDHTARKQTTEKESNWEFIVPTSESRLSWIRLDLPSDLFWGGRH